MRNASEATAPTAHIKDANPSIAEAAEGRDELSIAISRRADAAAAAPNTMRSPRNDVLPAIEPVMTDAAIIPKIRTKSRWSAAWLIVRIDVRDRGSASYMQKIRAADNEPRLRNTAGRGFFIPIPYSIPCLSTRRPRTPPWPGGWPIFARCWQMWGTPMSAVSQNFPSFKARTSRAVPCFAACPRALAHGRCC